jgi:small subunit ribosomal protein S9
MAEETKANESTAATETAEATTTQPRSRTAPPLPEGTQFVWGTGRRKKAIARVRIRPGKGEFFVNKRSKNEYFTALEDQNLVESPLRVLGMTGSYDVWANVSGGGFTGQAGAVALGLARAIAEHMPDCEHDLRSKGLLTRDARMKERKKPGQPGARKHFQFSKR